MNARLEYVAAARSDVGRKRSGNEDAFCLAPALGLFLVADGMGGHAAGEVASRLAVETVQQAVARYLAGEEAAVLRDPDPKLSPAGNALVGGIRLANRAIFEAASRRPEYEGMGTTLVAALCRDETVTLAHVGDSRIYRVRGDAIQQMSRDHSLVQEQVDEGLLTAVEAQDSALRHLITRALGIRGSVEADVTEAGAEPGDAWLLCSDGLSDLVEDEEMLAAVRAHADPDEACRALVERANYRGGDDNITVLIVQARPGAQTSRFSRLRGLFLG
ncbi:MAG: Stp1/IreP family PP2C-type Ser/Thr phosphatase [Candidatus Methylomirabilales bacterium]